MTARIIEVCDGVAEIINNAEWSVEILAKRKYAAKYTVADLSTTKVVVAPTDRDREFLARGKDRVDHIIDVAVFRHCPGSEDQRDAIVDEMIELCEQIEKFWMAHTLAIGGGKLTAIRANTTPTYDPEILRDSGIFASVITISLREVQDAR